MSFNPRRHSINGSPVKVYKAPNPHAGRKRSDSRRSSTVDYSVGTKTETGSVVKLDSGLIEAFYETIMGGNSTGILVNKTGERHVRVIRGTLCVVTDGNPDQILDEGGHICFKKGTKFGYSPYGLDAVEIFVVQTKDYVKSLKVLKKGEKINPSDPAPMYETAAVREARADGSVRLRRSKPSMKEAIATQAAAKRSRKETAISRKTAVQENANSSAAIGVNLKPGQFSVED